MAASTLTSFDENANLHEWSIRVRLMEILSGLFLTDDAHRALIRHLAERIGTSTYITRCVDPMDFTEKITCFLRCFQETGVTDNTVKDFVNIDMCSTGANVYLAGEILKLLATSDEFVHYRLLPKFLHMVFHASIGASIPDTTPAAPEIVNKRHDWLLAQRNNPYYFVFPFRQTHSSQGSEPVLIRAKPRTPKQDQSYQLSVDNDIKITRIVDHYDPDYGLWLRNGAPRQVEPFVCEDKSLRPRTVFHIDIPASLGMDANEVQAAIEELLGSLKKLGLDQQSELVPQEFFDDLTAAGKVEALIQDFSATNPHIVFTNDELGMIRQHLLQWVQLLAIPQSLDDAVLLSNEAAQRIWQILHNQTLAGEIQDKSIGVKVEDEAIKDAAESSAAANTDRTEPQEDVQIDSWAIELIRNYLAKRPNAVIPNGQEKQLHHDLVIWLRQRPIPQTLDQAEDYTKAAEKKIEDLIFVLKSMESLKKANESLKSVVKQTVQTRDGDLANALHSSNDAVRVKLPSPMELYKLTTLHIQQYFSNRPELSVPDHAYMPIHRSLFRWLTEQPLSYFKQSHNVQAVQAWGNIDVLVNNIPDHMRSLETSDTGSRAHGIVREYLKKHPEVKLSSDDFSEVQKRLANWLEQINEPALIVKMCQVYTGEDEKIQSILSEIQAQKNDSLKSCQDPIDALVDSLPASRHVVADTNTQVTVRTPQEAQTQMLIELMHQARALANQARHLCSTSEKMIAELRKTIPLQESEYFQRNQKPTL